MLRRSFYTALVVGTILTAINQGNLLLGGTFPAALAWKVPLTYCVPFCVATWGALINSRTASPPAAVADRLDTDRIELDLADEAGLAPTDSRLP
ncbi:MAG TPA: nitrate/nitrite transporter NrtS [Dehalococcoidia bacterium]|nr:nitrate/nitrite transporter NrtS [Dehalococcoidia bacterium]